MKSYECIKPAYLPNKARQNNLNKQIKEISEMPNHMHVAVTPWIT